MTHGNIKPPFCSKETLHTDYAVTGLSYREISKKYKTSVRLVKKWLVEYDIPTKAKFSIKDLTNKRFGKLVAIKFVEKSNRSEKNRHKSKAFWLCNCDCGKSLVTNTSSLTKGLTKSCGCLRKDISYRGFEDLSGSYINRIKKGATSRGLDYNVSDKYLWDLFVNQNKKCKLSGLSIELVTDYTNKHELNTASLDRIDNDKGYIADNVMWVHRDLNMMRRKHSVEYFISVCESVANHQKLVEKV